jgi:hypothetical protein
LPPPSLTQTERRSAQRYSVELNGQFLTGDGAKDTIKIINISSSGLQFLTEQFNVVTMVPNSGCNNTMSPISIKLSFDLGFELPDPASNTKHVNPLEILCGIVYVKRHSMTSCVVGCRFEQFVGDSSQRLSLYLATHQ